MNYRLDLRLCGWIDMDFLLGKVLMAEELVAFPLSVDHLSAKKYQ
jgi:hypothetical protein